MEPTAGTRKLVLLLAARRADLSEFRGRFTDLARERRTRGGGRWSLLLEPGEIVPVPHQEFVRNSPAPYDALIELAAPDFTAAATEAGRSVAARRTLLDAARSNAIACDEYCITQGDGPVFVAMQLRRLPALDRTQFMASWFGRHAELGARVEGVRYRQNHIRDAETVGLAWLGLSGPPLDGMALSYFDDPQEALAQLSSPAVAVGALADERTFIDHSRSQFGIYRTVPEAA